MALEADTIAGLILGVLGLIGLPMMYKFGKRIWKSLSSKIWPRKNAGVLPTTSTDLQHTSAAALATGPATSPGNARIRHAPGIGSTGSIARPSSHINYAAGRERQQNDQRRTTDPAFSPSIAALENEPQSVAVERRSSLRPTTPLASSTAVLSLLASSARNRHHGSRLPVPSPSSVLVANAPDSQSAPPSLPTADQPTAVSGEQHIMLNGIQEPTGSDLCNPSISSVSSLPSIHEIRFDLHSPVLVQQSMPITVAEATGHNNLASVPQKGDMHQFTEPASLSLSHFNAGASASSSSPNNRPVETRARLALAAEGVQNNTYEIENQDALLSYARLLTAAPPSQPEPQESLSSTSPNQPLAGFTATTGYTSSGTSAAAGASLSSASDRRRQPQVLSVRDGRRRFLETSPVESEADPTVLATEVEEVSPDKGPTTGGVRITILGYNFPSVRLYARFGDVITSTTRRSEDTLRCILPQVPRPCKVKVTLSQAPSHDSPEFGRSFAHFEYEDSRVLILSLLLKAVLEMLDGRSLETIFTSIQQRLEAAVGSSMGANVHTTQEHGGGRTAHLGFQVEELEDVSIRFLSAHSKATNWKQIVSLQNEFGQTMAHIAVMLGYSRLLGSLIGWGIDLDLTDLRGSTALHYASLCNESTCAVLLIRSGANSLVLDELGRSAWDLNPPLADESTCAVLLIRSGANNLVLDELGRSAWDLNPSLADECTSRLRDVPKVDGSSSVSCRPAEESEMERAEDAAALEATYLLVQRWLERMEEDRSDTNDLNGEHMPQFVISPQCLSPNLGGGNDLSVENARFGPSRPNQPGGMGFSGFENPTTSNLIAPSFTYHDYRETSPQGTFAKSVEPEYRGPDYPRKREIQVSRTHESGAFTSLLRAPRHSLTPPLGYETRGPTPGPSQATLFDQASRPAGVTPGSSPAGTEASDPVNAEGEARDFADPKIPPIVRKAKRELVRKMRSSEFVKNDTLEPIIGTLDANNLMAGVLSELWNNYGVEGQSIYSPPSDLNSSLGAILHSVGGTDENRISNHASTGKSNLEVQEETKMLNTKHSLVQQWAQQIEDERRNEVLSPKSQNPDILCPPNDANTPPVIDSTAEKISGVEDHQSPSSNVHSSQDVSPTVAPEETETQVGITFGSDIILPLIETSPQTNMNRPSHTVSRALIEPEAKMSSDRQKLKEQYPCTINAPLTVAQAYQLGVDLALPLPMLSPQLLGAPATSPTIMEMRIVHQSLPQPIFIVAATLGVPYIRIYDVLVAIHAAIAGTLRSLPGTKFVGLAYDVARSNRLMGKQDKYQDRTWILMTHSQFSPVAY